MEKKNSFSIKHQFPTQAVNSQVMAQVILLLMEVFFYL